MKYWKRLSTGKYIDLANLDESDINIYDIENSLNHMYRFNGHFKDRKPLTVAQHTLLVVKLGNILFEEDAHTRRYNLIHDFPEAYYGDIPTPLKHIMGEAYNSFADPIDKKVLNKFWVKFWDKPNEEVILRSKICDMLSLDIERRMMWKDQKGKDKWPTPPKNPFNMGEKEKLFDEVASINYVKLGELL